MNIEEKDQQIEEFADLWHTIFNSSKLNVCSEKLEGVTPLDISILRVVGRNPEVILREICKELHIVSSTLTSAVNRLEKRNFIKRVITNRDLRSFGLELTELGRQALEEHTSGERKILGSILDALDSIEERETFVRLFRKIVNKTV
ncbi:MAG: MarR family winged helix-turn-helix transcriptional regulator [Clostridia bacterium]|nr:MarR family winged helix-turn-helix transcriptional regulator [Clostridia bacterium]